mmetsp:Transcript_8105/g.34094  ORF Transcript_8105/g.34094 Transcript_8105/m.34094 type:complete len:566 (+) Transcript_8105:285-1982(+)|eukprot:CAMPEP_0114611576 /NCGR_PEP_ID=MMETSP0168-20121206/4186_1 /TAXON_ID=95228 ORGANISM="Vannella sp., Strain DIVA3 517/6/12" /NCGR_SAMPLE_ID=MMETSP0168 /ASSEMBLY_ACC=CAM_ASM_000044 /LENGTH=565 /DNA_ID=CAMNT_0001822551 /DNA_START=250 /DNA_END=1947 /DNA_ORIENTATION=-
MAEELDPFNEGADSKGKYYAMVVLTNKKLLLDDTYADLTIKVGGDTVYAHAPVVASRCEEILPLPTDEKSRRKKKHEVKVKNVASAQIMQRVLEFLYTGMVDFPKLTDKDILLLNAASRQFKLARLSYLCERWLREHMTIESVFHLLKAATDLNETRVKGFCMQFALQHYNDFISNKDGIYILGIELFQEVVAAFQTNPPPPEEITPDKAPQDTLLEDFKKMYNQMPFSDVALTIDGETIRCHKAILGAHSDAFATYLFKEGGAQQEKITATTFKSMLKFLYYGDDNIDPLPACELVEFSRRYKLHSLLRICEDKIRNSINKSTVLEILNVAHMPADTGKADLVDELKSKAYPFLLENFTQVDLSPIRFYNPLISIEILVRLQEAWKTGKYGLGSDGNSGPPSAAPAPAARKHKKEALPPPVVGGAPAPAAAAPAAAPVPLSLGSQRSRPAPPPRGNSNLPPPVLSGSGGGAPAPAPPPREKSATAFPPPSVGVPSPREEEADSKLGKKQASKKDVKADLKKGGKKDRKEAEKRKKDEEKRLRLERKERAKMEKKMKGGKGKDIF